MDERNSRKGISKQKSFWRIWVSTLVASAKDFYLRKGLAFTYNHKTFNKALSDALLELNYKVIPYKKGGKQGWKENVFLESFELKDNEMKKEKIIFYNEKDITPLTFLLKRNAIVNHLTRLQLLVRKKFLETLDNFIENAQMLMHKTKKIEKTHFFHVGDTKGEKVSWSDQSKIFAKNEIFRGVKDESNKMDINLNETINFSKLYEIFKTRKIREKNFKSSVSYSDLF
jgi:hypothetical protein